MNVSDLEQRVELLERQIASLEKQVNPNHVQWPEHEILPAVSNAYSSRLNPTANRNKQGNWLGFIAVLCFILAAGFIIKFSIDTGWLVPERQLGLALLLGVGLIGTGLATLTHDKGYASLLPAAGIIIFYLTALAAYRLYFLISFQTGLVLTSLISAISIWLYLKIRHDLYAVTASLGTYLAPLVLNLDANAEFSLYYYLICSCTYATLSIWVQSRTLTVISAYLAILISGLVGLNLNQDGFIALLLAFHFIIFAIGTYFFSQQLRQSLTRKEAWGLFPVLMIFYSMEYFYLDRTAPIMAPWISMGFAGFLIGLYVSAKKWFPNQISSQSLIIAFTTLVLVHSFYIELLPSVFRPWLFVGLILILAFTPSKYLAVRSESAFFIPTLTVFFILLIEYMSMVVHLININNKNWLIVSFVAFISMWLLLILKNAQVRLREDQHFLLLTTTHILGVAALYRLTEDSLSVSICWLLYAVAVISFAYYSKDKILAQSALVILIIAAGKALLYDAAQAPTLIRIVCLLLTGIVLYGCGFVLKKLEAWKS